MQAARQLQQSSAGLVSVLLKRTASGSDMQAAGTAAPPRAPPPPAAAADGRGNPAKRGRLASNGLSCGGGTGLQAAAIAAAAAAAAAAGSMILGVDYSALQQLSNTQAAQQLGASGGHALVEPAPQQCWQRSRHAWVWFHVLELMRLSPTTCMLASAADPSALYTDVLIC
jgi:hypothetical protein